MQIGEIKKNSLEKLVFEIKEFKGKVFIDIRTYFLKDHTDFIPTKKGITISPEIAEKFQQLLGEAIKKIGKEEI